MKSLILKFLIWVVSNRMIKKIVNADLYAFFGNVIVKTKNIGREQIKFFAFENVPIWRAKTLYVKEPETID
ncbi:hypothetical protein LEP1GSC137_4190 [Leptospira borgpetersenii str. Noumea 25]|nr:hypothetical protein LEP1GSC121_1037 [Leptospira borgpetersenii serovar Castellonis str. 200801910]EMO10149.1 hypothetical protein LEP1GSC137_4190 [Leptospira borgpetersenii str. Noumea 25]KGE24373.1 hypothetical protein IQ66_08045 [Leptospira borgpetersenii serovar Ballum]